MAEVPEEILITVEADDRATPKLTNVGRTLVLLGANIAYVTRELGIQSPALDSIIRGVLLIGHIARAATAAKQLLAIATQYLTATQAANTMATGAATAAHANYTRAAGLATVANYGLAASFRAVLAAMGPIGWLLLGLGIVGGAVAGYGLAGGFNPPREAIELGGGPRVPTVQVNIANANLSTKRDLEETVTELGTLVYQHVRTYRQ